MRCVTRPSCDSIFGDTYRGVPNPLVPHLHPYPTRYHGPIYDVPQATFPYRELPYAVAPFAGALGDEQPPLVRSVTGYVVLDGAVGAGIGWLISPHPQDRLMWTAIGGVATALAGTLGLVGTAVFAFVKKG